MRRGWFIVLALSLGLNAGLLYVHLSGRGGDWPGRAFPGGRPPVPVEARGPIAHPEGTKGFIRDRLGRVGERLKLSDEQIESMAAILDETMPELVEGQKVIRELRMQMREEYLKLDVDANRIQGLRRETAAVQSRLDSIMVDTMLREAEILTPEQREAYFELMPFGDKGGRGGKMRRGHGWKGGRD
jgi:Spy/CpxP family protein refolding chaperone